ncbi:hypothetical protein H113_05627 [Trichophyton rubrum MR1459]|nr:hypothetical protein H113_05627 [Trichophyton rubrum MR1459]EZG04504.1 hypothetical protein H106_05421 [Trichophyton rubrum CBS 735.88]
MTAMKPTADSADSPASLKSFPPITSPELQGKKAATRFEKMREDMNNESPEEITAYIQNYAPEIVREGDPIPYDTDAGIEYATGEGR